jgi:hypothetical protein
MNHQKGSATMIEKNEKSASRSGLAMRLGFLGFLATPFVVGGLMMVIGGVMGFSGAAFGMLVSIAMIVLTLPGALYWYLAGLSLANKKRGKAWWAWIAGYFGWFLSLLIGSLFLAPSSWVSTHPLIGSVMLMLISAFLAFCQEWERNHPRNRVQENQEIFDLKINVLRQAMIP